MEKFCRLMAISLKDNGNFAMLIVNLMFMVNLTRSEDSY